MSNPLKPAGLHEGAVKVCPLQAPVISRKVALMVHAAQDARPPLVHNCLEFLTQALRNV